MTRHILDKYTHKTNCNSNKCSLFITYFVEKDTSGDSHHCISNKVCGITQQSLKV